MLRMLEQAHCIELQRSSVEHCVRLCTKTAGEPPPPPPTRAPWVCSDHDLSTSLIPNEHFGIVPLEAMAAYRPVVALASGGPLESVVEGVTGWLTQPTAAAFAGGVERVVRAALAGGAGRWGCEAMGRAGREHVVARFSREAFAAQLEGVVTRMRRGQ
jgi:glycosyltransferase involved in cell wall biosynthesis